LAGRLRYLPTIQVLERLLTRLEKRLEALQRVKLDGFQMVISELEVEREALLGRMKAECLERIRLNSVDAGSSQLPNVSRIAQI
jgi:hypothetical protein